MKEEEIRSKFWFPALDLENGISDGDKGMRPTIVGAWKREKDEEGFVFFLDVQRRCGLSLVQVLAIMKGIWEEDNEAVSFSRDPEGRIIKFKLNPKKQQEEGKMAKKVNVKREGLKIIKKGKQVKQPMGKNAEKQQPTSGVRMKSSKNGNCFQPGRGMFLATEELTAGGASLDEILKRTVARFKNEKVGSDPVSRLNAVLRMAKNNQLKGLKLEEAGNNVQLVKVK